MSQKTVLVTGGTGFLGRQVVKAFDKAGWRAVATGFSRASPPTVLKCDLTDSAQVESTLDEVKPQVVIHCAAERFPDRVEANPDAARNLNINATESLTSLCVARKCLLFYISTDYVFPGTPGEAPYASSATPRPTNLYGQTKLDGEHAVLKVAEDSGLGVVFRVPVLYGPVEPEGNNKESAVNVLVDAVRKAEKGEKVVMDDWSIRYPTHTEDIGMALANAADKYLAAQADGEPGSMPKILQFSSEDRFTKYEICKILAEILGADISTMVANKEGNDPNAKVQRPYDCHLSTQALKDIGVQPITQDFKGWWRWQFKAYRH